MENKINWSLYIDDIAQMRAEGIGCRKIYYGLLEKYPDVFSVTNKKTAIRHINALSSGSRGNYELLTSLIEKYKVDPNSVQGAWIKPDKEVSFYVKPMADIGETIEEVIERTVKEHATRVYPVKFIRDNNEKWFDRLVYTDTHIGMHPDPKGISMYPQTWNIEDIESRFDVMIAEVISNGRGKEIFVDDLGDFLDGYEGFTTRGGHSLPQNLTTEQAYDLGIKMKVYLADTLIKYYEKVTFNNICNDNHAGSFAYMVNSAVKYILEIKYGGEVVVNNIVKFIDHYKVGENVFVLCHGKDKSQMKFAFPPKLDAKTVQKIDGYMKYNTLYGNKGVLEFSKGDSHQDINDTTTSDDFWYHTYPSLAPQSDWVKTNHKKGKSGFYFYNHQYDSDKIKIHPYFF